MKNFFKHIMSIGITIKTGILLRLLNNTEWQISDENKTLNMGLRIQFRNIAYEGREPTPNLVLLV